MISAQAMAAIEWLFENSIVDISRAGGDGNCVVKATATDAPAPSGDSHRLVVLSLSSYVFRIVALFDFDTDKATVAHLARIVRSTEADMHGQALSDAYAEFVNMVCGGVNRGLSAHFSHAGLSTPFVLENACVQYVSALNPSVVRTLEVSIADAVRFRLVLCVCVGKGDTLDFHVERVQPQDSAAGELELF